MYTLLGTIIYQDNIVNIIMPVGTAAEAIVMDTICQISGYHCLYNMVDTIMLTWWIPLLSLQTLFGRTCQSQWVPTSGQCH